MVEKHPGSENTQDPKGGSLCFTDTAEMFGNNGCPESGGYKKRPDGEKDPKDPPKNRLGTAFACF